MAVQRAVCIVRNESLLKQVFIVEPTTPLEEFRRMIADKFQHEVEELDLLLQNSSCPLLTIDASLATLSDTGIIFDLEARNNIMLLPRKAKIRPAAGSSRPPPAQPPTEGPALFPPPLAEAPVPRTRRTMLARGPYTGLQNNSNKCYLNSILQFLVMTPEFRNWVLRLKLEGQDCAFLLALQKLFIILETTRSRAVSTRQFTAAFPWCQERSRDQQDVQELLNALCDEVEKCCAANPNFSNIIKKIYEGKMRSYIVCGTCNKQNSSEMTMRDIQLPLMNLETGKPYETLEEALEGYVLPEEMAGANAYACDDCQVRTDSLKGLKLTQLPEILIIQFMRFSYDPVTGRGVKVNSKMVYPDLINMDRFVEGEDESLLYELFCVFVHGGSTQTGHYYAHLKDFTTSKWYCFNDESVSEICDALRERAFGGSSSSNAYMIAYRRKSSETEVAMRAVDFPTSAKILMKEYLYEKMESVYILYIHLRVKDSTLVHTFYINGEATVEELLSDAIRVFHEHTSGDIHRFRLVTYNSEKNVLKEVLPNTKTLTEVNLLYDIQNLMLKICDPLNDIQKRDQVENQYPLWHCGKKLPGQIIIMDNHQYLTNCDFFRNVAALSIMDEYFKAYVSSMSKFISQVFVNQSPLQEGKTIKNHNDKQNFSIARPNDIYVSIDPKFFSEDVYNKLMKLFVLLSMRDRRDNLAIAFNRRTGVLNINVK